MGASARSFRKADERAILRESIESRERTATANRFSREDIAGANRAAQDQRSENILSEQRRKEITKSTLATFQGIVTQIKTTKTFFLDNRVEARAEFLPDTTHGPHESVERRFFVRQISEWITVG